MQVSDWKNIMSEVDEMSIPVPPEELINQFVERTKRHVDKVNWFSTKLGGGQPLYPNHDQSKFGELLGGYCYFCKPEEERTPVENRLLDISTLIHIKNAPHHPEFWSDTDLTGFTRKNFTPNGIIDAQDMPKEALKEMACDWCAVSLERGNTPFEWFKKVNGTRWLFSYDQQTFLLDTLKTLWEE